MRFASLSLFVLACLLCAPSAAAQGIIVDRSFQIAPLELHTHTVEAALEERLAVVTVAHTFHNPGAATVEGTFLFPMPPGAQVSRFSMTVDGKEMTGELLDAEEARRMYEAIVRRNIDPALLELVDYRTFRARIFPIPPGASRTITLRYDATLPQDAQTVTFRYPLQGAVASRPVGGAPRPMMPPTWEHRKHPTPHAAQTVIQAEIRSATGIKNVYSPSHPIETRRPSDREAQVAFEASEVLDGHDFVLTYRLDESAVGATLLAHRPYSDQAGYFMLLLDPPAGEAAARSAPQDIVFVLDTSGSMSGEKMEQARDALRYCLTHLGARDRFGVVTFSSDLDVFRDEMRPASAADDALYFVDQLEASGGTNIHAALLKAAEMLQGSARGLIVFVTDGLPSVGTTDESVIRKDVAKALPEDTRLFAFGVGYDVNTRLLDGLADESGTFADYISPDESIDTRIASFFDKVRHPVLTDLALDFDGGGTHALAPHALPDLYKGSQLVVAGRYRQPGRTTLTLRGTLDGDAIRRTYRFTLPETEREQDFVGRLWATRRVGYLLEQIRLHGENEELKEEVIALAKAFGLVTPYTSYLVQEEEFAAVPPDQMPRDLERRMRTQAMEVYRSGMDASSGEAAVTASRQIRALKEAEAAAPATPAGLAVVAGRTMQQQQDGSWVDLDFSATDDVLAVPFASDAYFALLRAFPEARAFTRLGAHVTFRFHDRWIQVSDTGKETVSEDAWRRLLR